MRAAKWLFAAGCALVLGLWLNNSAVLWGADQTARPALIAHRGVHQIYVGDDRSADTCRAAQIAPPEHRFIENTLPSMQAAFGHGADVVELDVHLTADGVFAVFHDWALDCQTDGTGVTHEQRFADLKTLDLGYGYTADGTRFPLRGTGTGLMVSLTEVLGAGLDGKLLVNFKSRRREEGAALAKLLQNPAHRAQIFGVYGGGPPTRAAIKAMPDLPGFDRDSIEACLKGYMLWGWAGIVPDSCDTGLVAVPSNYAPFLWGWPHRFTARMREAGMRVILVGPFDGSGFTSGIDDAAALDAVPRHFDGYIWTNKIEVIGPLLTRK